MKEKKYKTKKSFRYEECEAKLVLEEYSGDRYSSICLRDKPDLQDDIENIGIEVTSSIPSEKRRQIHNWLEECEANGYDVNFWDAYENSDGYNKKESKRIGYSDFSNAFIRKRDKLNTGGYKKFDIYDLFILSEEHVYLEKLPKLLHRLVRLNKLPLRYSRVYMYTQCMLITFDLDNKTYKVDIIDEQYEIAIEAERIVEET